MQNFVDLSFFRVAFFDFDDTLYVHLNHGWWEDWWMNCFNGSADVYMDEFNGAPGIGMSNLLNRLRILGIPIFCLTWCDMSTVTIPKQKWSDITFGKDVIQQTIAVSSPEYKITFAKEYASRFGIPHERVLFVDDHVTVNRLALDVGFRLMTPQEVAVRYHEKAE